MASKAKSSSKKFNADRCRIICIGSLTTSLHVVVPLLKVMAQLGTVNVLSEDKSFLTLNEKYESDYEIGNMRVRVVDCVDIMDDEELLLANYDFTVLVVDEFLPSLVADRYIFLSNRDFYRQQMQNTEVKQQKIFSLFRETYHTPKERAIQKNSKFINEEFFNLPSFGSFDIYLYKLMVRRNFASPTPAPLVQFIGRILEGHQGVTKKDITAILRRPDF